MIELRHLDDVLAGGDLFPVVSKELSEVQEIVKFASYTAWCLVKGAGAATPVVRTLLLERVAWASARSRDYAGTRRALDAVNDAYENRSPGVVEPEWVYWLNRSEIDVMAGRCLIELGRPHAAEPLLENAIDSYDTDHAREVALYLSWLAEAYARAGTVDAAHHTLTRASRIARGINSVRLGLRINQVASLFPRES